MQKNEQNLRQLWDTTEHTHICLTGVPERSEKEAERTREEIRASTLPYISKKFDKIQIR